MLNNYAAKMRKIIELKPTTSSTQNAERFHVASCRPRSCTENQEREIKIAGYWLSSFLRFYGPRRGLVQLNHKIERRQ